MNYISHHGVMQDSITNPLRIVTNSSLQNGKYSLNECLVRGPNSLNPMIDIALRFRCHNIGMVFDLTNVYNALRTDVVEKHVDVLYGDMIRKTMTNGKGLLLIALN